MNDILVLEKQKLLKYPYTKRIEAIQKAYDFLEYMEDLIFVQQDKNSPDKDCVSRSVFKNAISQK
jgi:hypothetical protein